MGDTMIANNLEPLLTVLSLHPYSDPSLTVGDTEGLSGPLGIRTKQNRKETSAD